MPNALQNPQPEDYRDVVSEAHLDEIEAIARETESQCRTWDWLRSLSARHGDRCVSAIIYPGTMAGAASLVHRLESAGIPWQTLDRALVHGPAERVGVVAISMRVVDEQLIFDGERIRAHAGYSVSALVHAAATRGLLGLEFLAEVGGSLGAVLRRSYEGYIWRVIDEVLIARLGTLKVIHTRGEVLAKEQRAVVEGGLILAATLHLFKNEREGTLRLLDEHQATSPAATKEPGVTGTEIESEHSADESHVTAGEVIPLAEHLRERAQGNLDFELEYDVDIWRDEAEER